jgi:hypothetical protein
MQQRRVYAARFAAVALVLSPSARAAAQAAPTPLADEPTLIALAVSLSCANAPEVEERAPAGVAVPAPDGPELELVATVRAKALTFDVVPKVDVKFSGSTPRRTTWKTERVNLPARPEPGVTYHDVAVRLTITSTIEELGRLLAEAQRAARGIRIERDDAASAAGPPTAAAAPPAAAAPAAVAAKR